MQTCSDMLLNQSWMVLFNKGIYTVFNSAALRHISSPIIMAHCFSWVSVIWGIFHWWSLKPHPVTFLLWQLLFVNKSMIEECTSCFIPYFLDFESSFCVFSILRVNSLQVFFKFGQLRISTAKYLWVKDGFSKPSSWNTNVKPYCICELWQQYFFCIIISQLKQWSCL